MQEILGSMSNIPEMPTVVKSPPNADGGHTYTVTFPTSLRNIPQMQVFVSDVPVSIETVEDANADLDDTESMGGVQVEVDTVVPPGAMASGSVVFSDGVSKSWTIDQFGRLGLSGGQEGYKPSDEDLMEFQRQLEASLRNKGI